MSENAPESIAARMVGETPFTAEERFELRKMMKNFAALNPDDVTEVKKMAHHSRVARTVWLIIIRFGAAVGTLLGAVMAYKSLWGKDT